MPVLKQQLAYGHELEVLSIKHYKKPDSRKPLLYLHEYDKLFGHLRDRPVRLLELGVQDGYSLLVWNDYFSNATVVGVDQAAKPEVFPKNENFHFIQGDQADHNVLDQAVACAGGPFDIIIDDASHYGCFTAQSFAYLFPNHLAPGGFYSVEDICTSFELCGGFDSAPYQPPYIGIPGQPKHFPSHQHGIVGLVKQLIDHSMSPVATKTGKWTGIPIYRTIILPNIAIFEKLDDTETD